MAYLPSDFFSHAAAAFLLRLCRYQRSAGSVSGAPLAAYTSCRVTILMMGSAAHRVAAALRALRAHLRLPHSATMPSL